MLKSQPSSDLDERIYALRVRLVIAEDTQGGGVEAAELRAEIRQLRRLRDGWPLIPEQRG